MFFLKQIFKARERMHIKPDNPEGYMSVLDHLESLRRTVIRMLITVFVAMVLCFGFSEEIMDFLRYPAENMREKHDSALLPAEVDIQHWEQAKILANVSSDLPTPAADSLRANQEEQVQKLAPLIPLLSAARTLPQEKQAEWLQNTTPQAEQQLALALLHSGVSLHPYNTTGGENMMGAFQPGEAFMLSVQLAFFAGIIISFPLLMLFLLQFIVPGLHEHERRILYKSMAWGFLLFIAGGAFAYWGVLPRVLGFFYHYSISMGIENDWRIGYYLTFAIKLIFIFGVIFELPVIVIPLIKLGILNYMGMKSTRGYALIACFGMALVLAPAPDPGTMLLMALPMYALYELCILFARAEHNKQHSKTA